MGVAINKVDVITDVEISLGEIQVIKLLGEKVTSLQKELPMNQDELPMAYIDPQILVATGLTKDSITPEIVKEATISIDYLEGYPVVEGLPFWERLDGETLYFYKLFKCYRNSKEETGARSYSDVISLSNLDRYFITALGKTYHWQARVKAYDIYRNQKLENIRQENIKKMENKHTGAAKEMFTLCLEGLKEVLRVFKENKTGLTHESLREWFRLAIKTERLSLGLPQDKPLDDRENEALDLVTNYRINEIKESKSININVNKLEDVVNVLAKTGVLKKLLTDGANGNELKETNLIEIEKGGVANGKNDIS